MIRRAVVHAALGACLCAPRRDPGARGGRSAPRLKHPHPFSRQLPLLSYHSCRLAYGHVPCSTRVDFVIEARRAHRRLIGGATAPGNPVFTESIEGLAAGDRRKVWLAKPMKLGNRFTGARVPARPKRVRSCGRRPGPSDETTHRLITRRRMRWLRMASGGGHAHETMLR